MNILAHLPRSADQAITLGELAEKLNVSRREVEQAVQDARMAEIPVCSSGSGLWRCETPVEAMEQYRRLRSRALGQLRTAAAVKRAAFAMQRAESRVEQTSWLDAA